MQCYFSNKEEGLFEFLSSTLFQNTAPLDSKWIIVPNALIKQKVEKELAYQLGIIASVEVLYLNDAIKKILSITSPKTALYSELTLSCLIEEFLRNSPPRELISFLKEEKRISRLSQKLSHLFLEYFEYSDDFSELMDSFLWQEEILAYLKTKGFKNQYTEFLSQDLSKISFKLPNIHIFGFNYFTPMQTQFFDAIQKHTMVSGYFLSICEYFWTDNLSNREKRFIEKKDPKYFLELEAYIEDQNDLLANFGKLYREFHKVLEEQHVLTAEQYFIASDASSDPNYSDSLFQNEALTSHPMTLLEHLKSDLLLMKSHSEKIELKKDNSLQIHKALTRSREVQSVYLSIREILKDKKVEFSDILIMAPDIQIYLPYLKALFEKEEIPYQFLDVPIYHRIDLLSTFISVLELYQSRFEKSKLLSIVSHPLVCEKFGFTNENINDFSKVLDEFGVYWGVNFEHLQTLFSNESQLDDHTTYEKGFKRVFDSYLKEQSNLSFSDAVSFGKIIDVIYNLYEDMKVLMDNPIIDATHSTEYILCLLKGYFKTDFLSSSEEVGKKLIFEIANYFNSKLEEIRLPIQSVVERFILRIKNSLENRSSHYLGINCASISSSSSVGAPIVCLLGMGEDDFGLRAPIDSMNALKNLKGYYPTKTDEQREYFLETIASAKDHLIISYLGRSKKTSKQQNMSLLVSEFLSYLDSNYSIDKESPSKALMKNHPLLSFHSSYFKDANIMPFEEYAWAKSWYQNKSKQEVREFSFSTKITKEKEVEISLIDLVKLSRNPAQLYLNKELGIYLDYSNSNPKDQEPLTLSPLVNTILKNKQFSNSYLDHISHDQIKAMLPQGTYRPLVLKQLRENFYQFQNNLKDLKVGEVLNIELVRGLDTKNIKDDVIQVPAPCIQIGGRQIHIYGKFTPITNIGIPILSKSSFEESLKIWSYLLLIPYLNQWDLNLNESVLFLEDHKTINFSFQKSSLELYLQYYLFSLSHLSPLFNFWLKDLLKTDEAFRQAKYESLLKKGSFQINPYLNWYLDNYSDSPLPIHHWINMAKEVYHPLMEAYGI